jgi:hypothetical protein
MRASHRLLVTADEFATSNAVIIRFGSPLVATDASAVGGVVAVCADSVYVVFLIVPSARVGVGCATQNVDDL